jgi:putative hemolysin
VETHRDIVPIHFDGRNSEKFYRIANICKLFRLKFNFAMLFLADEMFKNTGKTFHVTIGKPIAWQTFDKSKKPAEWAEEVRKKVYSIQNSL